MRYRTSFLYILFEDEGVVAIHVLRKPVRACVLYSTAISLLPNRTVVTEYVQFLMCVILLHSRIKEVYDYDVLLPLNF